LAFLHADADGPVADSRECIGVDDPLALNRSKLGNALLVANIAPAFRRKLACSLVVVRDPGNKSTVPVNDADEPSIRLVQLTEDREKGRQADPNRYHPKRLTILEYRCLDCGNPVANRGATPDACDED